jgi:DNA-binding MarR family transcriptional regulator
MESDRPNFGHSQRKAQVLAALDDGEEMTASTLADCCGCSASNIRGVLSRLHDQGMAERGDGGFVPGAGQRAVGYAITEEGQRVLSYYREEMDVPEHAPPPSLDG